MSNVRRRFMRNKVTRWREGVYNPENVYEKTYSKPVTFKCAFMSGGTLQRDDTGAEFAPATTYYMKASDIKVGDKVIRGLHTNNSAIEQAETVRKIVEKSTAHGTADITVYTG